MQPVQPRFIKTVRHPERPRAQWTVFDRGTGQRYAVWGKAAADALIREIQAAEVLAFLDGETNGGWYRRTPP